MSNERKNSIGSAAKGTSEIIRVKRLPNNFVQMHKGFLEDPRLSFKAKGILGYLLTKPDNWVVRVSDLMNHARDGRDSVYAGLKELQDHRYYHKVQARDVKGRLSHWECFICEVPMATDTDYDSSLPHMSNTNRPAPYTENPITENPSTVNPNTEKPLADNPYTGKPFTAKPNTENPSLSNNYITNNDSNNNYRSNNDCSNNNHTPSTAPPAEHDRGDNHGNNHKSNHGSNHGEAAGVGKGKNPTPKPDSIKLKSNTAKIQYAEFVTMTSDEHSLLVAKIGENGAAWCIDKLDNYKGSTGKKYDNDYRTILSWVIGRYQEHLQVRAQTENSRGFAGPNMGFAEQRDYAPRSTPNDPQSAGYIQPANNVHVSHACNNTNTGDAFENYVYKKIEEAQQHGTT
jgi:hypothetical protein